MIRAARRIARLATGRLALALLIPLCGGAAVAAGDAASDAAKILKETGVRGGLIVHLGCGEGRLGGSLWIVSAEDGTKAAEVPLPHPVVWDGMAAAGGRLYVATTAGQVVCFGAK